MLDKVLKYAFGFTGVITGMTLMRYIFIQSDKSDYLTNIYGIGAIVFVSIVFGVLMLLIGSKIIKFTTEFVEKTEQALQKITLYELLIGVFGLIVGLVIANLISIPLFKIEVIGTALSIIINILLGICGVYFALMKRSDNFFEGIKGNSTKKK